MALLPSESSYSINTGVIRKFGTVDYVLFTLTLLVSAGIGLFYAILDRKKNSAEEFLLGGKKMSVFPVAMSLTVTFMSAATILGNPAEIYSYNTMFWYLIVGFVFAIVGASHIFIPFFYNLQITSTFEYLEWRFNSATRLLNSSLLVFQTVLYMAFLLYAPSLALNAVTGINLWGSVVGMGIVVTFYTTLGGLKATLWTDTFQAGIILAGLLAVVIQGSLVQGGFGAAWKIANNRSRILFDDFSVDPKTRHSVWSMVIGGFCFWVYLYGVNQSQVQRCLACPTVRRAQLALFVNLPGLMLIVSLCCMIGIVMFAFYKDCHPIKYGIISKTDQLVPLYVMDILGHLDGLPGIFVSSVVSGSLSSLSSGLNALSAVTVRDYLYYWRSCRLVSDFRASIISKLTSAFYGLLAIGLAWVVSNMGGVLQAIYVIFGIFNGPVLGAMTLGMFFPWANKWGAFSGTLGSVIILLWIGMGAFFNNVTTPLSSTLTTACNWTAIHQTPTPTFINLTTLAPIKSSLGNLEPWYRMSYMWYTGFGMILVWGIGLPISFCTGYTRPETIDPRLICPLFDKLFPYLPEKILKPLRFGIVHARKYDITESKSKTFTVRVGSKVSIAHEIIIEEKSSGDINSERLKPVYSISNSKNEEVKIDLSMNGTANPSFIADKSETELSIRL